MIDLKVLAETLYYSYSKFAIEQSLAKVRQEALNYLDGWITHHLVGEKSPAYVAAMEDMHCHIHAALDRISRGQPMEATTPTATQCELGSHAADLHEMRAQTARAIAAEQERDALKVERDALRVQLERYRNAFENAAMSLDALAVHPWQDARMYAKRQVAMCRALLTKRDRK